MNLNVYCGPPKLQLSPILDILQGVYSTKPIIILPSEYSKWFTTAEPESNTCNLDLEYGIYEDASCKNPT